MRAGRRTRATILAVAAAVAMVPAPATADVPEDCLGQARGLRAVQRDDRVFLKHVVRLRCDQRLDEVEMKVTLQRQRRGRLRAINVQEVRTKDVRRLRLVLREPCKPGRYSYVYEETISDGRETVSSGAAVTPYRIDCRVRVRRSR